ncbi:hypothetical protein [Methanoculleus sp.]|uniref:hypothetical protein n=1 Tax=Methanoculleus sp. TaxID=90427 RepID=UPI0025F5BC0B|nr:hypothetical protein [Methanoculleus sp.]MCK9320254.1 hypothetical protein [Methanoculleus sp.]
MKKKDNNYLFNAYDMSCIFNKTYHECRRLIKQYAKHKTYISDEELRFIPYINKKCLDDRIEFINKFGV